MTKQEAMCYLHNPEDNKCCSEKEVQAYEMAIKALEQEPCEDAISRKAIKCAYKRKLENALKDDARGIDLTEFADCTAFNEFVDSIPPVNPPLKTGHCKDCKYFEYDSVAKVDGIPLIVAHEICKRWGDGCKSSEDGYCFLFEPQESEG